MSQDERLREALLEIQMLKDRESRALFESNTLLSVLEAISSTDDPRDGLNEALSATAKAIGADLVCLTEFDDTAHHVIQAIPAMAEGAQIRFAKSFSKQRVLLDLQKNSELAESLPHQLADMKSMVITPLPDSQDQGRAFLCFHKAPGAFDKTHATILNRLVGVTSQALRSLTLSAQNAQLAAVIDGSSSSFVIADATKDETPLIYVNDAFENMSGYSADEVLGVNCRFLSAEDETSEERTRLRKTVEQRGAGRFLLKNRRKNGEIFWNDLSLFPVTDASGTVTRLVATQNDASDLILSQRDKEQAQARLQDALDHTKDAFLLVFADGKIGYSNTATKELFPSPEFDWERNTSFKDNWDAYQGQLPQSMQPSDPGFINPDFEEMKKSESGIRVKVPDGRQFLFRVRSTSEGAYVVSATDITALRNTERTLKQRAAAADNANDGILIADEDGRCIYANSKAAELMGVASEVRLLGSKWQNQYKDVMPEDPALPHASLHNDNKLLELKKQTVDNRYHEVSMNHVDKVGDVVALRNVTGAIVNSQRRQELNSQLEQMRRNDAVSTLAAGVAHDFNNVLAAINGSALLIKTDEKADPEIITHAERISKAGSNAARLVNRLLDLGKEDDELAVFDLRTAIGEAIALVDASIPPNVELDFQQSTEALNVEGSSTDASQILVNLVLNAVDAFDGLDGKVTIQIQAFSPTEASDLHIGKINLGQTYAQVTVSDDGKGIPKDIAQRIFEPYFSTKGSRGTGVGLPMVATIMKKLKGGLSFSTEPGKGTEFSIYWPLKFERHSEPANFTEEADLSSATILVLDDDTQVTEVLADFLENCGAEVTAIDDPHLAVEAILEDPDLWSALVTDYDMPELSGGDVVEKLRNSNAAIPIFVVTALARRLSDSRITNKTVDGVFAKPVDLRHLAHEIAKAMPKSNG